ncbi:MAG: glycosyltransferase family 2 protein [Ilumatobacteraceae bacterium]
MPTANVEPSLGDGPLTALVCTCNRPSEIGRIVRSLLQGNDRTIELIVVDQSDDDLTEQLMRGPEFADRVQYVRSATRGKGAAMNEGIRLATSPFVVCTDDDCEAAPGWVGAMAALLAEHDRVAVAFCRVEAPPHDRAIGYVPVYLPDRRRLMRSALATCPHRGIGAGMVLRRDVVLDLGGMDESFGPGARFQSGDDWDFEVRAILKGWHALETPELAITHHGFRTYAQGRAHTKRDWFALGGVAAKPLRAGHPIALLMALYVVIADAIVPMVVDVVSGRKPSGAQRIVAFGRGYARGLRTPVDRSTLRYRRVDTPSADGG